MIIISYYGDKRIKKEYVKIIIGEISFIILLPKEYADIMGIKDNDIIECSADTNKIIIQKSNQSKMHIINNPIKVVDQTNGQHKQFYTGDLSQR